MQLPGLYLPEFKEGMYILWDPVHYPLGIPHSDTRHWNPASWDRNTDITSHTNTHTHTQTLQHNHHEQPPQPTRPPRR